MKLATQRLPLSCRNESAREFREHDYLTLSQSQALTPYKGPHWGGYQSWSSIPSLSRKVSHRFGQPRQGRPSSYAACLSLLTIVRLQDVRRCVPTDLTVIGHVYGEYHLIPLAEILRPLANRAHTLGSPQFTGHAHHGTCCYLCSPFPRHLCKSGVCQSFQKVIQIFHQRGKFLRENRLTTKI